MFSGGFVWWLGSVRVSFREAWRPFFAGVTFGSVAIWLFDTDSGHVASLTLISRRAAPLAAIAALLTLPVAFKYGIFVAGGSDGYGYVSQAQLWNDGALVQHEQLANTVPSLGDAAAPLGYRLVPGSASIVPIYPPGLPIAMATAIKVAGTKTAVYAVVPLCGALTIWLTFLLGRQLDTSNTGLAAAILTACSPIFLLQNFEPMSDVPVTAFWLGAILFALRKGVMSASLAGILAAAAIITRPNLAPLAAMVGLMIVWIRPRIARAAVYAPCVLCASVGLALLNMRLYGSPIASGYGDLSALFAWRNAITNIQHYLFWLIELHSPVILLSIIVPFFVCLSPAANDRSKNGGIVFCSGFIVALMLCYLTYLPFETWPFLRFLLPGLPILFVFTCLVGRLFIERLPSRMGSCTAFACVGILAGLLVHNARELNVFAVSASEQRYVTIGEYLGRALPSNAVLFTVLHSGSLRWYGHRATARWDLVPSGALTSMIESVRSGGYKPYILLEEWEEADFKARFNTNEEGAYVKAQPSFKYLGPPLVTIWSADGGESMSSDGVLTTRIINRTK